jgi:hypothetical protein
MLALRHRWLPILAVLALRRWAISRQWTARDIGALAAGALVGRTLIGFLAPLSDGASLAAKLTQNAVLLGGVLLIVWLVTRRDQGETEPVPA